MRIKLFGTEIQITFLFTALISLMLVFDRTGLVLPAMFAVLLHELGHLFAMWLLDCAPKQIRLIPASVQIVRKFGTKHSGEMLIAAFGPLVNLVLFGVLYINYMIYNQDASLNFAMLNLIIALFNLIPINGLDGGTILFYLLCRKNELGRAMLMMRFITGTAAVLILMAATYLLLNGRTNISLFIIGIYLLIANLIKI